MQHIPAPVTNQSEKAPRIDSTKDLKEIYLLSVVVLVLAAAVAAFWIFSSTDESAQTTGSAEAFNGVPLRLPPHPVGETAEVGLSPSSPLGPTSPSTVFHHDIFFEVGRKGLTDEGRAALQHYASFLINNPDWGILLQGYTDQQGSISFNKTLGQKRAETVKDELVLLGVPESSIRSVSLGEEGALCVDQSDLCRGMNRRVHMELRKVGQEHMTLPESPTVADVGLGSTSDPIAAGSPDAEETLD